MTIAVAHSDTDEGRAALVAAAGEASARGTDLLVLHLVDEPTTDSATDLVPVDVVEAATAAVRTVLDGADVPAVAWQLRTANDGHDPAGALVDLLVETGAELLVLGSRRRSAIGKLIMGSTVQRVVLDSPVPVLVVKAATKA
ncbi:universal stress protein [Jannaschia sp. R86511]|uniref:universal stress protein n=1 Tax=Jannaschia sp. R86511 TaxID=3093853 RepID=UPI0036D3521D